MTMFSSTSPMRRPRTASMGHILHETGKQNTRRSQSPTKANARGHQLKQEEPIRSIEEIDLHFLALLDRFEVAEPTRIKLASLAIAVKQDFLRRESELTTSSFALLGGPSALRSSSRVDVSATRPSSPFRSPYKAPSIPFGDDDPLQPPNRLALFGGGRLGSSDSSLDLSGASASASQSRVASSDSSRCLLSGLSPEKKPKSTRKVNAGSPNLDAGVAFERNERGRGRLGAAASSAIRNLSPTRQAVTSSSSSSSSAALSPAHYAKMLLHTASRNLAVDRLRTLRVLLSSESPSWLGDFLFTHRGYEGMLKRIGELIEMEWREDIHDDKALHELLRGLVALGATEKGLVALSSLIFRPYLPQLPPSGVPSTFNLPETAPAAFIGKEDTPPELPIGWELHPPFGPLTGLLLSEKKPGELKTRRLLIDMLGLLLSIKLPTGLADADFFAELRDKREVSAFYSAFSDSAPVTASPLHLLLLLLHNPVQARSLSLLPFISMSHQPRPFKTYLNELLSVARDYFWVFCHSGSRFWDWHGMGEAGRREKSGPSVPGGMTDGVEWEAMSYLTANISLINRIAALMPSSSGAAHHFHAALFDSGMERLLQLLRKASQRFYPAAHLAIAHYLYLARRSGFNMPSSIDMRCEGGLTLRLDCGLPAIPARTVASIETSAEHPHERQRSPTQLDPAVRSASPVKSPDHPWASSRPSQSPQKVEMDNWRGGEPLPLPSMPQGIASVPGDMVTGQWLNRTSSATDDLAAATAFLASSASGESWFNSPVANRTLGEEQEQRPRQLEGRRSQSLSPKRTQRDPHQATNENYATEMAPRQGAATSVAPNFQQGIDAGPLRANAGSANCPSSFMGATSLPGKHDAIRQDAHGASVNKLGSGPHPGLVAVGTAKDRIKLWEGRAAVSSSGSGRGFVVHGRS